MSEHIVIGKFLRETFLKNNPQFNELELIERVHEALFRGKYRQGYREGVLLVSIDAAGFKRRVRELVPGDYLFGKYTSRVEGETPRKKVGVLNVGELPDAKYVDAVLYRKDVLMEDKDNEVDPTCDFEIVTFLAKDQSGDEPMDTETLMHNHFLSDGGTSTNMSDSEFVAKLRESHAYWKNRAHIH